MSTNPKPASTKGVRYTDAQKKEVVDFTVNYNAENGRGGQSKAAEKFNISQLTIAGWLKAAGAQGSAKAPKAAKPAKVSKKAKSASSSKVGTRYTAEQKQEVVDFTLAYNEANGRGGQSQAAAKFNVSPLTVMAWLKAAGVKGGGKKAAVKAPKAGKVAKAAKPTKAAKPSTGGDFDAKLSSLVALRKEITSTEATLAKLHAQFDSLKASL
jgi:transposase-like protein